MMSILKLRKKKTKKEKRRRSMKIAIRMTLNGELSAGLGRGRRRADGMVEQYGTSYHYRSLSQAYNSSSRMKLDSGTKSRRMMRKLVTYPVLFGRYDTIGQYYTAHDDTSPGPLYRATLFLAFL